MALGYRILLSYILQLTVYIYSSSTNLSPKKMFEVTPLNEDNQK